MYGWSSTTILITRAVVSVLAYGLAHLVARVRKEILGLGELRLVGLQLKLTAIRRDDAARRQHGWPGDEARLYPAAHADTGISSFIAHIADRRESGLEHRPGIRHALHRTIRVRVAQRGRNNYLRRGAD